MHKLGTKIHIQDESTDRSTEKSQLVAIQGKQTAQAAPLIKYLIQPIPFLLFAHIDTRPSVYTLYSYTRKFPGLS